jgi:hypothetical protein
MARILKKGLISVFIVAIMFSNVPYEFVSTLLHGYVDSRNIIDKMWLAESDENVVDRFIPFERVVESLKLETANAAASGDGKIFYSIAANTTPRTRDFISSTNTFNAASSTVVGSTALWAINKASPTQDEYVAGYVNSSGTLQIMCFNGTTWTNEWSVATGGTGTTRRFDIAYEKTSGDVMVVYSTNTATTNEMAYRTKSGGTTCGTANWSGATNIDAVRTAGIVQWVRLEGSPASGSNNVALLWADAASDLSAMQWTGASWGVAEPTTALETALEFVTAAQDTESFDMAYESTTGNLMVAWGLTQATTCTAGTAIATTNCIRYSRYTTSWSAVAAIPTVADPASHLDMSSNPDTNEIVLASVDNSQADLSAAYWSGSAWTGQANLDTTSQAATAGTKFVATGWLINGATTRSIVAYYDSAATNIGYYAGNAGVFTVQTDFTVSPVFGAQRNYSIDMNPFSKDTLMFSVGDTASDVHAKRLVMSATPAFTWTNSTGGAPVEANTGSATYKSHDFEYARFIAAVPTLTIGVTAGSKLATVISGTTSQYAQDTACSSASTCAAFTLLPSNSETLTSVKITETGTTNGTTNLSNVALFYDTDGNYSNGVTGQFGSTVATLTTEAATITGSLAMSAATTYYFYVRYDVINGANDPAGGETINWQIAANADVVSGGGSTKSGAPVSLAGTQTVRPNATSTTYQVGGDGGRSTYSATVTGNGFGVAPVGSRGNCTGAVNTGCVQFVVGGTATVATADVTAWTNRSITYTVNSTLASNGGASALQISSGNQTDSTPLTFYIYPTITSITNCDKAGVPSGAFGREYSASDTACPNTLTDGAIVITGDHLGSAGTVTIHGSTATQAAVAAFCGGAAFTSTCTAVQVPTAIANNSYTGDVVVTRTSDSKTHNLTGFRVLPRITSFTPSSAANGAAVTVNGDHFCQSGTCPGSFSAANKITFNSAQDATVFTSWSDTAMVTAVPGAATTGNVVLTSNTSYTSNGQSFTVLSNTPSTPTSLTQYVDSALAQTIATGNGASSTPIYLGMIMEVPGISGGTLYPQIEYKAIGTGFTCTGTASCASAVEGTGVAGPGPVNCNTESNNCDIAISPADNVYHWQARVCHNNGGTHTATCGGTGDYPSAWVSYGANAESATDFQIDSTAPVITLVSSGSPGTNSATITWSTAGEISSTQVQYNTTGTFVTNCATNNDCTTLTDTSPRVNSHSVPLSNLNSNTTYHYRVRSVDASGNEASSTPLTFLTSSVSTPAKTTRFHIVGKTGTVTNGSPLSEDFFIYMPEVSPNIKSSFIVITGIYETSVAAPSTISISAQYESETAVSYTLPGSPGGTFKGYFKINLPVTTPTTSTSTLQVTPDSSTTVHINSADMYLNYSYTP